MKASWSIQVIKMIFGHITNPPESAYGLWYDVKLNRFKDEDGNVLHDLHDIFPVWQLDKWKRTQSYGVMVDRKGELCELYWCDEKDCECDHSCEVCESKCEIYDLIKDW